MFDKIRLLPNKQLMNTSLGFADYPLVILNIEPTINISKMDNIKVDNLPIKNCIVLLLEPCCKKQNKFFSTHFTNLSTT